MKSYFAKLSSSLEASLPLAEGTRNELAPRQLQLSAEAKRIWIQFHNHVQKLMRPDQPLAPVQRVSRQSGRARCASRGDFGPHQIKIGTVGKTQIEAGIVLAEFYLNEALRLFNSAAINPDLLLAEKLLTWARGRGNKIYARSLSIWT